jgi:hypothetical protein
LLTPAERPWSETLRFEALFTRRLRTSRLRQELSPRGWPVQDLDLEYAAYRVRLPADGAINEGFPARVDLGENTLGLGPGFPLAVQTGGGEGPRVWARWTGAAAELPVPWPAAGAVEVVVRAASTPRRPAPARMRLLLDGRPLGDPADVPVEMSELVFTAAPESIPPRPRRRLRIESSTWNPREQGLRGYPDGLGVLVDWVEIRPVTVTQEAERRRTEGGVFSHPAGSR